MFTDTAKTVTVVIPTIPGREKYLERAVESVRKQQRPADDLIVEKDVFRTGAAATRNRALKRVETDYVAFLDDDDYLYPNHLRVLMQASDNHNADVFYPIPDFKNMKDPTAVFVDGRLRKPWGLEWSRDHEVHMLYRGNFIPVTVLAKTHSVRIAKGFPTPDVWGDRPEDWGLFRNMLKNGAVFRHVPKMTWCYVGHDKHTKGLGKAK